MIEIVISLLLLIGTFFIFSGSLGILRFRDVYLRIHAVSKSSTLGVASIMIAAFLFFLLEDAMVSGKLILGIIFVLLTSPVSGHLISRAAYRSGVPLWEYSVKDELNEHNNKIESKQSFDENK